MLTTCCICAVPLLVDGPDDGSIFCPDCYGDNLRGAAPAELEPLPRGTVVALTPREVHALTSWQRHLARVGAEERDAG